MPCAACGVSQQVEAAHTGTDGGMAQKSSDYSCIPLCCHCHIAGKEAYHRVGRRQFERNTGLVIKDLVITLNALWQKGGSPPESSED